MHRSMGFVTSNKPCSHIMCAFAFVSKVNNGFHAMQVIIFTLNICIFNTAAAKIKDKCKRRGYVRMERKIRDFSGASILTFITKLI